MQLFGGSAAPEKAAANEEPGMFTGLSSAMADAADAVQDAVEDVVDAGKEIVTKLANEFEERRETMKELLELWTKRKFQGYAEVLIDKTPGAIKYQIDDPYMPQVVRTRIWKSIDALWPDVRQEIIWEMQVMVDGDDTAYTKAVDDRGKPDCCRGFFRYHLFPYDKGIWERLRDPVFVITNILAVVPYQGVYAAVFCFIFLIIDKFDEYQLVYFILSFKGAQFISWGLVKGVVGFGLYFGCVTFPDVSQINLDVDNIEATLGLSAGNATQGTASTDIPQHTCRDNGPGMSDNFLLSILSWLVPLALCWIALLMLPFSKEKGRSKLKGNVMDHSESAIESEQKRLAAKELKGGYIRYMLIYDFVIFCLCIVMMFVIFAVQPQPETGSKMDRIHNPSKDYWQVYQTLYFCQFFYGLFSVVFIPFNIPFVQAVLTHSPPTAYDEFGRCVKFKGADKPTKEQMAKENKEAGLEEPEAPSKLAIGDDTADLVENFKTIFTGGTVDMTDLKKEKESPKKDEATPPEPLAESVV